MRPSTSLEQVRNGKISRIQSFRGSQSRNKAVPFFWMFLEPFAAGETPVNKSALRTFPNSRVTCVAAARSCLRVTDLTNVSRHLYFFSSPSISRRSVRRGLHPHAACLHSRRSSWTCEGLRAKFLTPGYFACLALHGASGPRTSVGFTRFGGVPFFLSIWPVTLGMGEDPTAWLATLSVDSVMEFNTSYRRRLNRHKLHGQPGKHSSKFLFRHSLTSSFFFLCLQVAEVRNGTSFRISCVAHTFTMDNEEVAVRRSLQEMVQP